MGHVKSKSVIVVTGTLREAAVIEGADQAGVHVIAAGSDPERMRRELEEAAPYACGLISFGMCGAIDRSLQLGRWVIGKRLLGPFHARCDERWVDALQRLLPTARVGAVYADGHMLTEQYDKSSRAWSTAALAADMESHIVGEVAARHDLPFAVLRCVSDIADMDLPPAVEVMMRPDGGLALGAVLKSILGKPAQVPHLVSTVAGFARAYRELGAGVKETGARFGFDLR